MCFKDNGKITFPASEQSELVIFSLSVANNDNVRVVQRSGWRGDGRLDRGIDARGLPTTTYQVINTGQGCEGGGGRPHQYIITIRRQSLRSR